MSANHEVVVRDMIKPEYKEYVVDTYNHLKTSAKDLLNRGLNSETVLQLTELAMRYVGKLKDLAGSEKKALVLTVVRRYVEETAKELEAQWDNATDKLEEVGEDVLEELKDLYTVVDQALDPYIDQVYALAPEVYGHAKRGLAGLKEKLGNLLAKCSCTRA